MNTIRFFGGASEVSGACFLVQTPRTRFLVDCGLFQGGLFCDKRNYNPFPFSAPEIDFVLVTHAHIDHTGRLPKLVKDGFQGRIYSTPSTKDLADLMLEDSQGLLEEESSRNKMPLLYSRNDVQSAIGHFIPAPYYKTVQPKSDVSFRFIEAGHILGSSIIEVEISAGAFKKTKMVFTGDLGNPSAPLLRSSDKVKEADYLVIESAYGDRNHETKEVRKDLLEDAVEETIKNGGVLLIPAFAVERVQELLFELNNLVEQGHIPSVPVFLDSPLAIKATSVYANHESDFNAQAAKLVSAGEKIFAFPGLKFTQSVEESKAINEVPPPKIIIAGSGNSMGGRILHHERRYLSDPKSAILIVGYQNEGSLGRRLVDGAMRVKIFDEEIPVRARVIHIDGYSAHADQKALLDFVEPMHNVLKRVFVVQGEPRSSAKLAQKIRDEFAVPAEVPVIDQEFQLP